MNLKNRTLILVTASHDGQNHLNRNIPDLWYVRAHGYPLATGLEALRI